LATIAQQNVASKGRLWSPGAHTHRHTHIEIQDKARNDFRLYSGQVGCMGIRIPLEYPQFELAFFPTALSAFYLVPKNSHRFFFKCQLHWRLFKYTSPGYFDIDCHHNIHIYI